MITSKACVLTRDHGVIITFGAIVSYVMLGIIYHLIIEKVSDYKQLNWLSDNITNVPPIE